MEDKTEMIREEMVQEINSQQADREELEKIHGKVYSTKEVGELFRIEGFLAPFCFGKRISTGEDVTLMFQHHPRFYWEA